MEGEGEQEVVRNDEKVGSVYHGWIGYSYKVGRVGIERGKKRIRID